MRFVSLVRGTIFKARRSVAQSLSLHLGHDGDDSKDPDKIAEQLRQVTLRLNKLEAALPPEATEFEVGVSTGGTIVELAHGYGCPVRWWVTCWTQTSGVAYPVSAPALAEDSTSDANTLRLRSYVAGRVVVRVEPAQTYLDPGIIVTASAPTVSGVPTGTGFYHVTSGAMDAASKKVDLAAAADVTGTLPLANSTAWVTRGAFGSRPSAGTAGRIYLCTDGPLSFYDDGAAWQPFVANNMLTGTPAVSGLTQILAGGRSITLSDSKGGILMALTNPNASEDYRIAKKSRATGAFTFTVHMTPMLSSGANSGAGVCWREASTGRVTFFGIVTSPAGTPVLLCRNDTANNNGASPTFTISSDVATATVCGQLGYTDGIWLRLRDDNTNKFYEYSLDGQNWITYTSVVRTSFFTPDEYGIWVSNISSAGAAQNAAAFFDSWTP